MESILYVKAIDIISSVFGYYAGYVIEIKGFT